MRTGGWPHPVTGHDWEALANQYRDAPPVVSPIAQIVDSIISSKHVPADRIVVEHVQLIGIADVIERDASDAVPLFWAFMREKYGLYQGS